MKRLLLGALVAVPLAPGPLPAAAGLQVEVVAVAAAAEGPEALADDAGVDGKGASSSSHISFSEDGPLLCSHLFGDNRQHLASYAKISGHFLFFSFHQRAPVLG